MDMTRRILPWAMFQTALSTAAAEGLPRLDQLDSEIEGTQFVEQGAVAPVQDRTRSDSHLQLNLILVDGKALDKRLQDRLSAWQCPKDRRHEAGANLMAENPIDQTS